MMKRLLSLCAAVLFAAWFGAASAQPSLPPLAKQLKPEETALIYVDFQNNFAAKDGEHYPRLAKFFEQTRMLENAADTIKRARAMGVTVVHVTEAYTNDYRELDPTNPGRFHRSQILRQSWKMGTRAVEIYEPVRPGPNDKDIVLPNRIQASGFGGNGLDAILRGKGIRNVVVAGFTTDVCVYATTLAAYDLGYHVYAVKDLIAPFFPELSEQMFKEIYPMWSRVLDHKEVLSMLEASKK
jgi:nicotinamidase-related amidase